MLGCLGIEDSLLSRSYALESRGQAMELARTGMGVKELAGTCAMDDGTSYSWLGQDRRDRGEAKGR